MYPNLRQPKGKSVQDFNGRILNVEIICWFMELNPELGREERFA